MKDWWRGAVIYQIYPRSFMDGNGDGVGDLPGILPRLDHIASLGADAIWISPFFKSPMKDFGYDVSDYRDVDPVFGTIDDFKKVLDRAHALKLKVLIDQVWSHTSDEHGWFKESRASRDSAKSDWYVWRDAKPDGTAPNNWLSYFGGPAWTWDARREQYYLHHFLKEQPNLNIWSPAVRKAIKDTAAFWLDMGVDGFRLDAAHTYMHDKKMRDNPPRDPSRPPVTDVPASNPMQYQQRVYSMNVPENLEWIEELRAFIDRWPERCLLGEAGGDNSEKEAAVYTQTGKRFHEAYSFGLVGSNMTKDDIAGTVGRAESLIGDGWICWAVSNHDFKRAASRLQGNAPQEDKALFATALGLSLRGSYCLYQGEELGLPQAELAYEDLVDPYDKMLYPEHVGRDGCRTPMPWTAKAPQAGFSKAPKTWLPLSPLHAPLAVDAQSTDPASVLNHVRAFLAWRRDNEVLRHGMLELLDSPGSCFVFRRKLRDETMTCLFNCGDAAIQAPLSLVHAGGVLENNVSRHASIKNGAVLLGPFGYAFFKTAA